VLGVIASYQIASMLQSQNQTAEHSGGIRHSPRIHLLQEGTLVLVLAPSLHLAGAMAVGHIPAVGALEHLGPAWGITD